jgi:hypothetical protein
MLSFAINGQSSNQVAIDVTPNTGTFLKDTIRKGYGKLTVIDDNPKMDAVAVLNPSNNGPKLAVYIGSNDSFTISGIEDGLYDMYFEIGNIWNSSSKKFTDKGGFYRLDRSLLFETTKGANRIEYRTWTVALEAAAPNANVAVGKVPISEEEFPI